MLKKFLKNIIPHGVVEQYYKHKVKQKIIAHSKIKPPPQPVYDARCIGSYSQLNEDLIIDAILRKEQGFYIDIGAHNPLSLSNTKRFYDKGWHGINIEPNPALIANFNESRPRDINLNIGVGVARSKLTFYELTYPTLSSFDKDAALHNAKKHHVKIEKEYEVEVIPLREICQQHAKDNLIDFLSIDTEGYEMEVLTSNNWERYRPTLIIIEPGQNNNEIYDYLVGQSYQPVYRNGINAIFIDSKTINK